MTRPTSPASWRPPATSRTARLRKVRTRSQRSTPDPLWMKWDSEGTLCFPTVSQSARQLLLCARWHGAAVARGQHGQPDQVGGPIVLPAVYESLPLKRYSRDAPARSQQRAGDSGHRIRVVSGTYGRVQRVSEVIGRLGRTHDRRPRRLQGRYDEPVIG